MANIVGIRNRLIHAYFDWNVEIIWATLTSNCRNSRLSCGAYWRALIDPTAAGLRHGHPTQNHRLMIAFCSV